MFFLMKKVLERAVGIEPTLSAWKAGVIAIIRCPQIVHLVAKATKQKTMRCIVIYCLTVASETKYGGGRWIRTTEAYAADLQSAPFGHSGTPPGLKWCRLSESN